MDKDTLARIKAASDAKLDNEVKEKQHKEAVDASKSLERTIFESFKALTSVVEGTASKGEAVSLIIQTLDNLEKRTDSSTTEIAMIKSGLETLEEQLEAIPTGDLKQLPKFLERPSEIKINNLEDVEKYFKSLEKAIKSIKTTVEAPKVTVNPAKVNVPAPVVNVPEVRLEPLVDTMLDVIKAVKSNKLPATVQTEQTNLFISEKFDEYKVGYSDFSDDEDRINSITYFFKGKQVAKLMFSYDKGKLTGVKKK